MKRRALLIGNSNGLGGVKVDIANYVQFLKSDFGGQWFDSEINIKMNPSKIELLRTIQEIKNEKPDYAFVVFSGHGAYSKGTVLEINAQEESINEIDLKYISSRQVSIFDCCRNVISMPIVEKKSMGGTLNFSDSRTNIRVAYEARILQSIEQQISLYACAINESALDTDEGGMYSKNLLKSARAIYILDFLTIGVVHEKAAEYTKTEAFTKEKHNQNPTAILPKCISSQQLIFTINPRI